MFICYVGWRSRPFPLLLHMSLYSKRLKEGTQYGPCLSWGRMKRARGLIETCKGPYKFCLDMGSILFAYVSLPKQLARINAMSIEWEVCFSDRMYVKNEHYFLIPQSIYWNLISTVMVIRDEAFGRQLGYEGRALMHGICGLRRQWKDQRALFLPCEDTGRREQSVPGKGPSPDPDHTGAWPQTSRLQNCGKYIVVLKPPVCGILL